MSLKFYFTLIQLTEMYLLQVTKFESVWSNFDLLPSTYFYIYVIIFRRMLKVARMLTNVKAKD